VGSKVRRFPVTGNETVRDALAKVNGLANVKGLAAVSPKRIWVARPVPHTDQTQIMPVDLHGVTAGAVAATNFQILPGDRIFVAKD